MSHQIAYIKKLHAFASTFNSLFIIKLSLLRKYLKARARVTRSRVFSSIGRLITFGRFFENYKSIPNLCATISQKNGLGYIWGKFFSLMHLVTLERAEYVASAFIGLAPLPRNVDICFMTDIVKHFIHSRLCIAMVAIKPDLPDFS
jgi:hypothetical protein